MFAINRSLGMFAIDAHFACTCTRLNAAFGSVEREKGGVFFATSAVSSLLSHHWLFKGGQPAVFSAI
jgi:hypothetical protein